MSEVALWCGFVGAWLLVAGPVWQAVLELREEDIERERLAALADEVGPPRPISPWWWLLPPVALLLRKARADRIKQELILHLGDEDFDALMRFMNKASGWLLVGCGGFLIATNETWDLVEGHEWPSWLFPALLLLMLALSLGNATLRAARERSIVAARSAGS